MGDITDEELNDPGRTRSAFGCSEGKNHILDEEAGCELCRTRRERDEAVELLVVIVDRLCHNEVNGYLDTRGSAIDSDVMKYLAKVGKMKVFSDDDNYVIGRWKKQEAHDEKA